MRIAAGTILIILGIVRVVNMIVGVSVLPGSFIDSYSLLEGLWTFGYWGIVYGALFITGGILCIGKRYWGLCLISALLGLVQGIYTVVQALVFGYSAATWETWILVVGALIATILISLTKYEWEEISD
jgi:uncharacterized membrane protein